MPSGVIKYEGRRGVVWRVKYEDANGKQVQETLGSAAKGWTRRKAEAALRSRRVAADEQGMVKLDPTLFATFAAEWNATYPDLKSLKRSTRQGYATIINRHLVPAFGSLKLDEIDRRRVTEYVAAKRRARLAPRSINRHLNLLHQVMESAVAEGLVRANPVSGVTRPSEPRRHWTILTPEQIARVEGAFVTLAEEAETHEERVWVEQARVVFVLVMGAGMRRGEVLGLRWRNVHLADPDGASLRVSETWVRDAIDTPKSESSERTIALGQKLAGDLFDHRGRTAFDGEDERVFCHPETGGAMDHKRYAKVLRVALGKAEITAYVRPFHDGRHTSITNGAKAGMNPMALMQRAGHSDFKTTQIYIDLAGEAFRDEADLLEQRLWGAGGTNSGYKNAAPSPSKTTGTAL